MRDTYSNVEVNATNPFLGSCKRCASDALYVKQQGMHLALLCRQCNLWQQWISKSDARRYQREKVRLSVPLKPIPTPIYPEVGESIVDLSQPASHSDLSARVERLERAFAGYDSQLEILVRAVLACGVLQGTGSAPGVNVDDTLVDNFLRTGRET
jgi:hypothetical protein